MTHDKAITLAPAMKVERSAPPTVLEMIDAMVKRGVTSESVAALTELNKLHEAIEDRQAEKDFNTAFVKLQADIPRIKATKPVPNNDGTVRYKFAPYEELMSQVQPLLQKHGFAVSFSSDVKEGRFIEICTLAHVAGHSKTNQFAVRIGSGPPKATETQADGAAATYAKRYALCNALNIVISALDDDAAAIGPTETITQEQAESLRERVHATGSDETAFLKFAHQSKDIKPYEQIPAKRYSELDKNLRRKEKTA